MDTRSQLNKEYLSIVYSNNIKDMVEFYMKLPDDDIEFQKIVLNDIANNYKELITIYDNEYYNFIFEIMFANKSTKVMLDFYIDLYNKDVESVEIFSKIIKNRVVYINDIPKEIINILNPSDYLLLHTKDKDGEYLLNNLLINAFENNSTLEIYLLFNVTPNDYIDRIRKYYKLTNDDFKFTVDFTSSYTYYYNYKLKKLSGNVDVEFNNIINFLKELIANNKIKDLNRFLKQFDDDYSIDTNLISEMKDLFFHNESLYQHLKDFPEDKLLFDSINISELNVNFLFIRGRYSNVNVDNFSINVIKRFNLFSINLEILNNIFTKSIDIYSYERILNNLFVKNIENNFDLMTKYVNEDKLKVTITVNNYHRLKDDLIKLVKESKLTVNFLKNMFNYLSTDFLFELIKLGYSPEFIVEMAKEFRKNVVVEGFDNYTHWFDIEKELINSDFKDIFVDLVKKLYKENFIKFPPKMIFNGYKIKTKELENFPNDLLKYLDFYTLNKM